MPILLRAKPLRKAAVRLLVATCWRQRVGEESALWAAHKTGGLAIEDRAVVVDTTVEPEAVAHPTDEPSLA